MQSRQREARAALRAADLQPEEGAAADPPPPATPDDAELGGLRDLGAELEQDLDDEDLDAASDGADAATLRAAAGNIDRRVADAVYYQHVVDAGFTGRYWELLIAVLVPYALPVLKSWMRRGTIFTRCAERGRPLHPSDTHRERLRTSLDDRDELAGETIAEALILFARLGSAGKGWTLAGGAALTTFFIGTCVACFPTVWRRWVTEQHDEHLSEHLGDHLELAALFDHAARRVLDPRVDDDPADTAAGRDLVRTTLAAMDPPMRDVAEQLVLHGSTFVEIAAQTGTTAPAVEQRVRRYRKELTRRRENRGAP